MQTYFTKTWPGRELQLFYNRNINRAWSCKEVEVWFRCGINKIYSPASFYGTIANIMVELITAMAHVKIRTVRFRTRCKIEVIENCLPRQNGFLLKVAEMKQLLYLSFYFINKQGRDCSHISTTYTYVKRVVTGRTKPRVRVVRKYCAVAA